MEFNKYKIFVCFLFVSLATFIVVSFFNKNSGDRTLELKEQKYSLINKTKVYNLEKHYIIDFSDLKKEFVKIQSKYPFKTYIYFNYLNNGSWIGLGEKEEITAASLVKVPLSMSVYKSSEEGRINLGTKYTIDELDLNSDFGDLYKKGPGDKYTVEDLVKIMLEQSDNTARSAVSTVLSRVGIDEPLEDIYNNLGWEIKTPTMVGVEQPDFNYGKISLKVLSNMFLSLYNSTYLSLDNSQKILKYLSETSFNDRIRAGVPKVIPVSHKIGESYDDRILSDCGIIYAPNRNYLLCVATQGGETKNAPEAFMAEISKATYSFVINN